MRAGIASASRARSLYPSERLAMAVRRRRVGIGRVGSGGLGSHRGGGEVVIEVHIFVRPVARTPAESQTGCLSCETWVGG